MNRLRIAVVGGGHLGTIHARLLAQVADAELAAIVEPDAERAAQLANDFPCPIVTDCRRLLGEEAMDAAVLAAPTSLHHDLGMLLLKHGIPTFVEKPLAPTAIECQQLVEAAEQSGCVLQVGHVERFSPVWTALCPSVGEPRFIEAVREGPLVFRSLDVGVVLDLMIHDIDLVLSLVDAPVVSVQAVGFAWTGPREDIAQARLTFANGCVAQLKASRVSCAATRRMNIYGADFHAQADFGQKSGYIVQAPSHRDWQSRVFSAEERKHLIDHVFEEVLPRETLTIAEANPILDELRDFVRAIGANASPRVSGHDGLAAVDIADQVIQRIEQRRPLAPSYFPPVRKAG